MSRYIIGKCSNMSIVSDSFIPKCGMASLRPWASLHLLRNVGSNGINSRQTPFFHRLVSLDKQNRKSLLPRNAENFRSFRTELTSDPLALPSNIDCVQSFISQSLLERLEKRECGIKALMSSMEVSRDSHLSYSCQDRYLLRCSPKSMPYLTNVLQHLPEYSHFK